MTDKDDDSAYEAKQSQKIRCVCKVFSYQRQGIFAAAGCDGNDDESGGKENAAVVARVYVFRFMAGATLSGSAAEV